MGQKLSLFSKYRLRGAFTLIEVLVAMAVMAVLLIAIGSITSSASLLSRLSHKRMEADAQSRLVFDRLSNDLSRLVNRSDADFAMNKLAGNDTLYFYSEAPAIAASATVANNSSVALVGYRINSSFQMERLGQELLWTGTPSIVFLSYTSGNPDPSSTISGAFSTTLSSNSSYQVLGETLFRLEFCFLLKPYTKPDRTVIPAYYSNLPYNRRLPTATPAGPGHSSIYGNGLCDVQAIVVTVAILDTDSRKLLPATVDWTKIVSALKDPLDADLAASPAILPGRTWQAVVDSGGLASAANIPQAAAGQIRVYQRIFGLPPSNP